MNQLNLKAVNIAILLKSAFKNECVTSNSSILEQVKFKDSFRFDATHHPHVTLLQFFVEDNSIDEVCNKIDQVVKSATKFRLPVKKYDKGSSFNGNLLPGFEVEVTQQLKQLHLDIRDSIKPLRSSENPSEKAFYQEDADSDIGINEDSIKYASKFIDEKSGDDFKAHASCGVASEDIALKETEKVNSKWKEDTFEENTIVLAQLGNYCTCRKILKEWNL